MPRTKQQNPVEAEEADVAVRALANGKGRRLAATGAGANSGEKTGNKPTNKAPIKPANTARNTVAKTGGVTRRAATKAARGADKVAAGAAKREAGPKAQGTSSKPEKAKAPRAGRAQKPSGPEDHAGTPEAAENEPRDLFLQHQRVLLMAERNNYTRQAEELRAQAEALALEHEPGDVQFDEEGGEGGTANVDRELDLHLSAQAHAAIEEIDAALVKITAGTYGFCESCGNPVPKARLEALPHARLCVSCKSGGLSARRQ